MKVSIPEKILETVGILTQKEYEAFIVGGCVRDLLLGKKPKDWDIATNAKPEDLEKIFPKTFYNNSYGTVTIVWEEEKDETLKNIEITPFRKESSYSDKRHPDTVVFAGTIEDDLSRRDFTVNAIAYEVQKGQIIDPFKGQKDLKDKIIRSVGDPEKRFSEDALRLMRAVRFATVLDFSIEKETLDNIKKMAQTIEKIAIERIRDEFSKIILSDNPKRGFELLNECGLLKYVLPELQTGIGIEQNEAHAYDVWEHTLRTVQHSAKRNWPFHVRLAALFHDIAKPETRRWSNEKNNWTFYGHDVVGSRVTKSVLKRLKYPKETVEVVSKLVRFHLFFSDVDKITMSAVRRLIKNVGKEYIWDLMNVRACDRIGTGRPKEAPYRLRKFESMIEEALRDPISVGMLSIDGNKIMEVTREKPGPKIGAILNILLDQVLEDPQKNKDDYLKSETLKLSKMSFSELSALSEKARRKSKEIEKLKIKDIRKKHWVQ
jgi:tRNA nucleotidyltransferase/poly(A) polymerase